MRSSALRSALSCALLAAGSIAALAQTTATLTGSVVDSKGALVPHANVVLHSADNAVIRHLTTDDSGHFIAPDLKPGIYGLDADATGFSVTHQPAIRVSAAGGNEVTLTLRIADASMQIEVQADTTGSVAAALAPMDAPLTETSARTEITQAFIQNFVSPVADYGEIVQMAPGTFTTSSNGVGLGQSKTFFRGFPDGYYDIDFDDIGIYDTNTPTHHSWAFAPAQFVGGVDFDRSPGTASTVGPTPFGGTIHLQSRPLSPLDSLRVSASGGSYNTYLYDAQYDPGSFGPGHKFNLTTDIHHLQSRGYQTLNIQTRNAGDLKLEYKITDKTVLTGYSAVIWLDSNNPNFNATRCQMYGQPSDSSYDCHTSGPNPVLLPYTGAGINFLNADNSDPVNYLDYKYNYYHVPTDFEYVGLHHEFGKNFIIDIKPYTYNYDNSEKYSNAVPITESTTVSFNGNPTSSTWYGTKVQPCMNIVVTTKKGNTIAAEPCGVDKYNSYRKYGETAELSQVSRFGILRTGLWFERGLTNRHQYPSDPLNNWADQALPNFAEKFTTDSYQPFIEYELHIGNNLTVLPGVKWAYYSIGTQQFADDGKTLGCFVPVSPTVGCDPSKNAAVNPNAFVGNSGNYFATLPSLAINYRIRNNWSVYVQGAQGSIVPPSSVFDFQQNTSGGPAYAPLVLPKQQKNTTYQTGTVLKLKHVTFDADYYHIHFDNSYSSFSNATTGFEPVYFLQPSSVSQGIEGQSNINFTHGIGAYLNASFNSNFYTGKLGVSCNTSDKACTLTTPQVVVTAPGGLHIAQTPTDIETEGVTYQHRGWDAAIFGHRVGKQYLDNGQYHNTSTIDPFNTVNAFINYTIRTGGRLDQSKLRLSFNNLFDSHSITNVSYSTSVTGNPLPPANGTTYTDPFTFQGSQAISGADNVSIQSGRSIMLSLTVGFSLHKR